MSYLQKIPSFSSSGASSQPEEPITIHDLESDSDESVTIRTSAEQENPASVNEIVEDETFKPDESETDSVKNLFAVIKKTVNSAADEYDMGITIFMPTILAEKKYLYQPSWVSIGPHNRGLQNLQFMEDMKRASLKSIFDGEDVDSGKLMIQNIKCLKDLEERARMCYQRKVDLSHEEFVQVLLFDGLFIIRILRENDGDDEMDNPVFRDIFLLENQVPLFVIEELWNLTREDSSSDQEGDGIARNESNDFACFLKHTQFWKEGLAHDESLANRADHLLDLYYKWNVPIPARRVSNRKVSSCFKSWISQPMEARNKVKVSSIPSASELYEAGIQFKKKAKSLNTFDVSFENGFLEIPTLILDSVNMSLMANLLSHEKYGVEDTEIKYVTCYVFLMDSLINTKEDVALLQKFDVLINKLASDDEAAIFINSIGEACGITKFDASKFFYTPVVKDMMNYYASSWRQNWTSLKQTYFSNPWTGISVIAGSTLMVLTVIQTVYTVLPYLHPN